MENKPFFSVIIPAHNAENHITKGLESIRSQSFKDYELIVVCDSCVDRTEEIAKAYGAITKDVSYGYDGLTRNEGIKMARGEWVLFMDDDDWFLHEYAFQLIADMVGKHDEDALVFAHINRLRGYVNSTPKDIQVPVWTKCWRQSFIKDITFSNRHYWSDCDFHNKVMKKPHRFVYWDMPIYYYNFMRKGSITQRVLDKEIVDFGKPCYVILHEGKENE